MRTNSEKPWYRKVKDGWYAWVDGKQRSLGVKGKDGKKAAQDAFYRLMSADRVKPQPKAEIVVKAIVAAFLTDAVERVKPETMAVWKSALNRFAKQFGERTGSSLKPPEVEQFARRPNISNSTVNAFLTSVITCFRWAVRAGLLTANPLNGIRKPPCGSRGASAVLTDAEFVRLHIASSATFKPFLRGLWLTGCRPGELARLTVQDVDFTSGVAVLTEHKTSGKTGKPRLIFLSAEAVVLFREQAVGGDLLFRNKLGRRWTRWTMMKAIQVARKKAGLPKTIVCYSMRHSYATAALVNGVPDATVAALLGHSGTAMLHKHYSHLTSRVDVLRAAAGKVR
ncbi:MAG: tyrosine-type recombinase/integrase [Planctomycetes bacterium]|nr:tyrosine-type recombinase/integrase [Planctomycetota bacterium]